MYDLSNNDVEMCVAAETIIWSTMRAVADGEYDEADEEMGALDDEIDADHFGIADHHRQKERQ